MAEKPSALRKGSDAKSLSHFEKFDRDWDSDLGPMDPPKVKGLMMNRPSFTLDDPVERGPTGEPRCYS